MPTTNKQQVAALLKAIIGKGVETKDAVPTIKTLIEAKIFVLKDLSADNMPPGIHPDVQQKLLPGKKRRSHQSSSAASKKPKKQAAIVIPPVTSRPSSILINRSPVLTLWASIVALHKFPKLSFPEALTVGSAFAAHTAKGKGTSLGIYSATDENPLASLKADKDYDEEFLVMGVTIRVKNTTKGAPGGVRAIVESTTSGETDMVNPSRVWNLLKHRFKDGLGFAIQEMQQAARAAGGGLESTAYQYYMHIRPDIPSGTKGWGAHGHLDTTKLSNFYPTPTEKPSKTPPS